MLHSVTNVKNDRSGRRTAALALEGALTRGFAHTRAKHGRHGSVELIVIVDPKTPRETVLSKRLRDEASIRDTVGNLLGALGPHQNKFIIRVNVTHEPGTKQPTR